ncbi:uncharacterized protein LOC120937139 [Rana temporaria]|nr:uncharacterized protein LOC120937139 [Rana temporaria]
MDNQTYLDMCQTILKNNDWYCKISINNITRFYIDFYKFVDQAFSQGVISLDLRDFIRTKHPKTATFYSLPKVHKNKTPIPGRPIVSGIGSISENLSQVIDAHLQPYVTSLPSFTKDTMHFLQTIEGCMLCDQAFLVSIDVEALYSSIPHEKGLSAIEEVLTRGHMFTPDFNDFLIKGLRYILYHNFFSFDRSHYLQVQGVAMGTCCAPSYANLYLGEWERSLPDDDNLVVYLRHIKLWRRYIDDIFIVWDGPEEDLLAFFNALNINDFNLTFTMIHDKNTLTFLDVKLFIDPDRYLRSTLFRKATAGNTILHFDSHHPIPLKSSIPYGQYLRLRRNCSTDSLFREEADQLQTRLLTRGYSRKCLRRAYNRSSTQLRNDLLSKKKTITDFKSETTRPVFRYSLQHKAIKDIIQKHWTILTDDPKINPFITTHPSIIHRRAMSIRDSLVSSEFKDTTNEKLRCSLPGTFQCGHCSCCYLIRREKTFSLPNGETFKPKYFVNCRTRGVVYLMECECGAYYIGKTKQEFQKRISKHKYSMTIGNIYLPIGRHVALSHNYRVPHVSFAALDHVLVPDRGGDWNKTLLQREQKWIFRLGATQQPGLNDALSFAPFLKGFTSGKTQ